MKPDTLLRVLSMAAALLVTTAPHARAQGVEIGASLAGATIGLGEGNDVSTVGIPSSGFGILSPGVYASLFVGERVAIEPRIGFVWVSGDGDSAHFLNLVGQVDYFINGIDDRSLYLLGAVGIVDVSDSDSTPTSVAGGVGYRIPSERLTLRLDGRVTRFSDDGGNMLSFTLSIGGLFGRR